MEFNGSEPLRDHYHGITRRHFLGSAASGIGAAALSLFMNDAAGAATINPSLASPAHFAPTAKRVIYLHMAGGPPPMDMFDYKPELKKWDGKPCPEEMIEQERFAFIQGHPNLLATPHEFKRHGQSGAWVTELLPHMAQHVDDMTFVRSVYTDEFNHAPAKLLLHTGFARLGRPSMGSWVTYGLGTENQNLPGFVVLISGGKTPSSGKSTWGSGFLPSVHQGVQCRSEGDPVLFVSDPKGLSREGRRRSLDALNDLNHLRLDEHGDPETLTRIQQYELAFRMQISVPEVMDISREDPATIAEYGAQPGEASFANNCLLARRLVEQGTRFVQLFDWGWDTHGTSSDTDLITALPRKCQETDKPIAALLSDLKRRGLLEETLVVWSGEFGRTPMNEERNGSTYLGRDHNPHCFTIWMAGGGIKRGAVIGATDDFGYRITERPVHVHDLQATILHCLGINHERLTYRFQGRDFRLTDVHGNVVHEMLA